MTIASHFFFSFCLVISPLALKPFAMGHEEARNFLSFTSSLQCIILWELSLLFIFCSFLHLSQFSLLTFYSRISQTVLWGSVGTPENPSMGHGVGSRHGAPSPNLQAKPLHLVLLGFRLKHHVKKGFWVWGFSQCENHRSTRWTVLETPARIFYDTYLCLLLGAFSLLSFSIPNMPCCA